MLTGFSYPELLEELAAPHEAPGAGSALAVALAVAAAVVQMAARLSVESWRDAAGVAAQAELLRERAARLAEEDADTYRLALQAQAGTDPAEKQERRDWTVGQVTAAAAEPPLALTRLAVDLAQLCATAAKRVEPHVHADIFAAATLAAAVARGSSKLVAVNLTALPGDSRVEEAEDLAARADRAARALALD